MRSAQFVCDAHELCELQSAVAIHARGRGASGDVIIHEWLNYLAIEFVLQVDCVVRNAQMMRDTAGIFDVFGGATASGMARLAGGVIPQVHRHSYDVVALLFEQSCGYGAVNAATHGYK